MNDDTKMAWSPLLPVAQDMLFQARPDERHVLTWSPATFGKTSRVSVAGLLFVVPVGVTFH